MKPGCHETVVSVGLAMILVTLKQKKSFIKNQCDSILNLLISFEDNRSMKQETGGKVTHWTCVANMRLKKVQL